MAAVPISAALAAVAGVWNAFYYNNLFPETAFGISRSIEMTLSPIIGGLGPLFGPFGGAVVLTGLREIFTDIRDLLLLAGPKQIFFRPAPLVLLFYPPPPLPPLLPTPLPLL